MADLNTNFAIRQYVTAATGPDGVWGILITPPIECSQIVIENKDGTNAQLVRTDPADPDTQKTLPANLELTIRSGMGDVGVFQPGKSVCRVAPAAGTGPICVTFIR